MKKYFFSIFLFCLVTSSSVYAQITPPDQASTGYGSFENYISDTYSSHELGVFEEGTQLFYYIPNVLKNGASAPAVIFLHGMFATTPPFEEGNGYSDHLIHLLRQGYIVIYPQFNTDSDVDQNLLLDRCVASTNTALTAIGASVETDNLVLYGHSVGGILSVCWGGAGGVPVKALVTAQGNMNPCAGGQPAYVCPLITKLDYQTMAPSMTCPAILLWGDADFDFATWSQQLDAFNSLTNVSSKVIYIAQSDDYGDPDLIAGHVAPNPPVDTLDYRYYWAALDAALDDQTVVNFDMGLWSDGTPVKPVIESLAPGLDCLSGTDNDMDGVCIYADNCPDKANSGQEDADYDGIGDVCEADTIYGTVTGDVQEGVTITLKSVSPSATETTTVGDGTYSFTELANGDYTVTPSLAGYSFAPENTEVTITGPSVPQVNFVATKDCKPATECPDEFACGDISDGCGGTNNCGECGEGESCVDNICIDTSDNDDDGDGVTNENDECLDTPAGEIVAQSNGCSIEQLVPCEGPKDTTGSWKNHGQYVSAFTKTVKSFIKQKLIAKDEKRVLMKKAASSDCGKDDSTVASEYTVVCDQVTSLCWQDPQREAYNYDDIGVRAFEADQYCEELILGGFEDWRVPTISELRSITAGFPGTESDGDCPVVDGNITYADAAFQLSCFNIAPNVTSNGPGDNGCYLKPGFTGTCDKPDPYSGGHPLEHVALETPSDTDIWRSVLMFENGSVLFNHACTGVDVRCVRDDDGSPIVDCVEGKKKEACDPGTTKSCECSGFGDRPDGIQTCNEAGDCWGPCECTRSIIDTSVDSECYAGDEFYDQAAILTANISLPQNDSIDYDPAVVAAFLYECPAVDTAMPSRPPDGGSWENQIIDPGKPPYSIPIRGITYYRENLIEGRYCLLIQMSQQNIMPPIPKSGDYYYWDPTQGIVFSLDGDTQTVDPQTVDVTLIKIVMPSF